jgi:hypothetical protein
METTTPPAQEPTIPPSQETNPPIQEQPSPPVEEPSVPIPSEQESVIPEPEQVISNPLPVEAPTQEPSPSEIWLKPEPIQEIDFPVAVVLDTSEPTAVGVPEFTTMPADPLIQTEVSEDDQILTEPSQLRQAAQTVVVPPQTKLEPWNQNTLFARLIGLAIASLIAGLVVARRGVPGVIAS